MKKRILIIMFLVVANLVLSGETFTHKTAGISIWFPDNWKVSTEESLLEAEAPDEDAYAQLLVLENVSSMEEAVKIYTEELDKVIKDVEITTDAEEVELNGLNFFITEGIGTVSGVKMQVGIALILTPKPGIVMMVTINTLESNVKYEKDFKKIVNSVKAI